MIKNLGSLSYVGVVFLVHAVFFAVEGLPVLAFVKLWLTQILFFTLPILFVFRLFEKQVWEKMICVLLPGGIAAGTFFYWVADVLNCEVVFMGVALGVSFVAAYSIRESVAKFTSANRNYLFNLSIALVIVLALAVFPTNGDGVVRDDGQIIYTTTDSITISAIAKVCLESPIPQVPNFAKDSIAYHYFAPYYITTMSRISGVPIDFVYGYWYRYICAIGMAVLVFSLVVGFMGAPQYGLLAVVLTFGVHGLNIAYYWFRELLSPPIFQAFFVPHHGVRQLVSSAQFGNFFTPALTLAALFTGLQTKSRLLPVFCGCLIGIGAMFHLSTAVHTIALLMLLTLVTIGNKDWSKVCAFCISATAVTAAFMSSGILSVGGGSGLLMPTFQSMSGQVVRMTTIAKWFGVELISFGALLFISSVPRNLRTVFLFLLLSLWTCPFLMLAYNSGAPFYANYWATLPSFFLPILTIFTLWKMFEKKGLVRGIAVVCCLVWMAQLFGGGMNLMGTRRIMGSGIHYPRNISEPLVRLFDETRGESGTVISNTILIPLAKSKHVWHIFVPSMTGKASLAENTFTNIFHMRNRDGYEEVEAVIREVFSSDDLSRVRQLCRDNNVHYVVQFAQGPQLHDSVASELLKLESTIAVEIYRID
ncbi:MAG: hypothetical protein JKX97_06460 [Candidatus Lindowbacteria bacterium]|nr:hypothetical protein [Candidatus Lindowbacteria bacterium]